MMLQEVDEAAGRSLGIIQKSVVVAPDADSVAVVFDTPLANANYNVLFITPSWPTTAFPTDKTKTGFTIVFGNQVGSNGGTVVYGVDAATVPGVSPTPAAGDALVTTGAVLMVHNDTASSWTVYKPDGTLLDLAGTTSQGLQEAINFAATNAYVLKVYGGGITPPSAGSNARSRIVITQPITIPTGWGNGYYFYDVDLWWDGASNQNLITFESMDYSTFVFNGQIVYDGDLAAVYFKPTLNNGESFIGITSSNIHIGTIAVVNPTTHAPEGTHGTGVRFSPAQNLSLSPTNGNGLIISNEFSIGEINGGLVGIQIDDPTGTGAFILNKLSSPAIHGQGSYGVTVGQSAASAAKVYGNIADFILSPTSGGIAISTWAQEDIYRLSINSGATGIYLNTSADKNQFVIAHNGATTKVTDNSTTKTNLGAWGAEALAFSVHKGGVNQTAIVTATATKVTWGTEEYDIGSKFAANAWTPGRAGRANIYAQVYWVAAVDGASLELELRVSNTVIRKASIISNSVAGQAISLACDVTLTATDYVEIFATQFSGSNQIISGGPMVTFFTGHFVN